MDIALRSRVQDKRKKKKEHKTMLKSPLIE